MLMKYTKFEEVMILAAEAFATWDENMKDFTNVAREGEIRSTITTDNQCHGNGRKNLSRSKSAPLMQNCKTVLRISGLSGDLTSSWA